jgi:hypothetical protein
MQAERHAMSRTRSRTFAVALFAVGVAALLVASRQSRRPPADAAADTRKVTILSSGARPIKLPKDEAADTQRGVRLDLPAEPPIGRTVYVDANARGVGDGSHERPLRDLQAALCGLGPGDRLIIWDGEFAGPFVIGEECKDGTSEAPIDVYAAADSVLRGGVHTDEPVLTVARAHWNLHDLMVVPLESLGGGVVLREPARDVVLDSPHIRSGRGNGIEIHPGVSGVLIEDAHLHHLGIQEGGHRGHGPVAGGERVDPATTPPGAGIRIYPGTRAIRVLHSEIRNIFGQPLEVLTPEQHHDPSLAPAADLEIDESGFGKEEQEQWW